MTDRAKFNQIIWSGKARKEKDFMEEYDQLRMRMAWAKRMKRYPDFFTPILPLAVPSNSTITGLVRRNYDGTKPYGQRFTLISVANMIYAGSAKTEEEARGDLGDIMSFFKVIFKDLETTTTFEIDLPEDQAYFAGLYASEIAEAKLPDGFPFKVELVVPWLPSTCKIVKTEEVIPQTTETRWSVSCTKEGA